MIPKKSLLDSTLAEVYAANNFSGRGHYRFLLNDDFRSCGIRYLHYYDQEKTLCISNISKDGNVHLVNLVTGQLRIAKGHHDSVRKINVKDHELITSSWDCTIRIRNFTTLRERLVLTSKETGRCPFFNVSHDGKVLFSFTYDSDRTPNGIWNRVTMWDLLTGDKIKTFDASKVQPGSPRSGSVVMDEERIYVASDHGSFRIFDVKTGRMIENLQTDSHFRSMTSLFHFDSLLLSTWDGVIMRYSISSRKFVMLQKAHSTDILCMRVHPDPDKQDILFTTSGNGELKIWQMHEKNFPFWPITSLNIRGSSMWSMVFINNRLVVGNEYGETVVFNISDLSNIVCLGRLVIANDGYVVQIADSPLEFYCSNKGYINVEIPDGNEHLSDKEASYLVGKHNSILALHKLFGMEDVTCKWLFRKQERPLKSLSNMKK